MNHQISQKKAVALTSLSPDMQDLSLNWREVRLSDVCQKSTQIDPHKEPNKSFIYVDVSSVSNESFRITKTTKMLGKDAPSRARKLIHRDDIIFATVRPTLKRIAIVPSELDAQVCSTGFCVIRAQREKLEPAYAYFYLLTERIAKQVDSLQKGVAYPAINDSDLFLQLIPLPPLPEQRAIAYALRAVQEAKETRQRELTLQREHKAGLMQHLFTHGTRGEPRKQTEIGEMPESWRVVKLGEVAEIRTGTTPSTEKSEYYDGDIAFIKTSEIANNRIVESQTHISNEAVIDYNLKIYPPATVFMAMYGQGKTRGQIAILEIPAATTQNTAAMIFNNEADPEYTWQLLMGQYDDLRGAGSQGHISHLNLGYVKEYKIAFPCLLEQQEIASVLRVCDDKIAALEREMTLLDELFQAMLEELMTGRLSAVPLINESTKL